METEYDDEAFQNFIICEDGDEEKEVCEVQSDEKENVYQRNGNENSVNKPAKRLMTKKEQFSKIIKFTKDHNEDNTGKLILDELWKQLTVDLNEIGPPIRNHMQWRRVWSTYKYNMKRLESNISSESSAAIVAKSQSRKRKYIGSSEDQTCSQLQEIPQTNDSVPTLLRTIIEQQSVIIQNQVAAMAKSDKSNELLAVIADKTYAQKKSN